MIRKFMGWWFGFDLEILALKQDLNNCFIGHPKEVHPKYYLGEMKLVNIEDNKGILQVRKKRKKK